MPVLIDGPPMADFAKPFDLLRDCHRRIELFVGVLSAVAASSAETTLDDRQRSAVAKAIRYFEIGLPLHTADEEESLFPRLREASDERARPAQLALERLESEHREQEQRHRLVHELTTKWLQHGPLTEDDAGYLRTALRELERVYRLHIDREETEVLPIAAQVLPSDEIRALAREMKERRRHLTAAWARPAGISTPDTRVAVRYPVRNSKDQ